MFHSRVRFNGVGSRLDAGFYNPDFIEAQTAIERFPLRTMDSLRAKDAPIGYGVVKPRFQESPVRMARIQDFSDPFVDLDLSASIDPEQMRVFKRSMCLPGDLLVAIGGYPGRLGLVPALPKGVSALNINQHVVRVRLAPDVNRYFVAAYLMSSFGAKILARQVSGSVQAGINVEDFRKVCVPYISVDVQRYIGDKLRQAERLRERARWLEACFRDAVTVAVPRAAAASSKSSRVHAANLGRNLNPGAYAPDRRSVRQALVDAGGKRVETLGSVETPTIDSFSPDAIYIGLDAIDAASCVLKPSTAGSETVAGTARRLREGPAISRLRPYLNKVTYIPPSLAGGVGSTELLLVHPKEGIDGWFLYGVLKLESSVRQLNPVATGSTHPRIDRDDVLDLLVPWHEDQQRLGAMLRTAQGCYFASAALTATATALVEELIQGRVTELDLSTAQQALEAGDRGPDRGILKLLLQTQGHGVQPLIPDVDDLYLLLDSSEDDAA